MIDIVGYFTTAPASDFVALDPVRILDSRPGESGLGVLNDGYVTPWGAGVDRPVQVTGLAGVPGDGSVTAVAVHVTSVNPSALSFLTAYPAGGVRPTAASKNYGPTALGPLGHAGLTNDLLIVKVGAGGQINLFNNAGSVDLVIDIVGYFTE